MNPRGEPGAERGEKQRDERPPGRPACPVCGAGPLVEQRGKLDLLEVPDDLRDLLRRADEADAISTRKD